MWPSRTAEYAAPMLSVRQKSALSKRTGSDQWRRRSHWAAGHDSTAVASTAAEMPTGPPPQAATATLRMPWTSAWTDWKAAEARARSSETSTAMSDRWAIVTIEAIARRMSDRNVVAS